MADVEAETIILQGTFAARPAAAAALAYYVTTGANAGKRYWSDGSTWFEQPPTVETHVHAGADITSGTVADARIDAALARDSEVTTAVSTHAAIGAAHAAAASQAEMEAGTEAALRAVSPLRVAQAIAALAPAGSALPFDSAIVATDEGTTSATYVDLATAGPAVTLTVNTKVKITLSALLYGSTAGCGCRMGVALSSGNTVAASNAKALTAYTVDGLAASRVIYLSGLTPGSTVFTAKYARITTGTGHFVDREILVELLD